MDSAPLARLGLVFLTAAVGVGGAARAEAATETGSKTLFAQATGAPGPTTATGPSSPSPSSSSTVPSLSPGATTQTLPPTKQERQRVVRLARCLRVLQPTDRRVISLRYGLGGRVTADVVTVAQRTGLSVARVQDLARRALRRLLQAVNAGPTCGTPVAATRGSATSSMPRPAIANVSRSTDGSSSSRHYIGLTFLILGLAGLAGVPVYTMREIRRSL